MRRLPRLGLLAALLLPVIALGGYVAFWFIVAGRIENALRHDLDEALRPQQLALTWQSGGGVGGFPLRFSVELDEARLQAPAGEVKLPRLTAAARPWSLRLWQLTAPQGLTASAATGPRLTVQSADGTVAAGGEGGAKVWLRLANPVGEWGVRVAAKGAELWLDLPPHPPRAHTEPTIGLALALRGVSLPSVPAPFKNPLDELGFGVTLLGPIPAAPARQAAASWRDAGGTLELDRFTAQWGSLRVTGSGTLALDGGLQPMGALSGAVEGYDQLLTALVAAGRMRAGDASLAQMALSLLARPGAGGRPEIATSFTIQNGQMFLGPAKLGPAPRIDWQ